MTTQCKYLIALSFIRGMGNKTLKKLLDKYETPKDVWDLSNKEKNSIKGVNKNVIEQIGSKNILELVKNELEFCEKNNIRITTILEDTYPTLLKECIDAPPVVFQKGNMNLENGKFVGVVGTRKMTSRGKEFVHELIKDLSHHPITIVSGLAFGIDTESHKAAIENKMQTIGVMAHGVNQIYPRTNEKVGIKMQEFGGLFSEFSSFQKPIAENFLRRNRIIAGLSHATIIVESGIAGGAMNTARHANNYNRDVFALPGRTSDATAAGCHYLIKNHQAFLITNAEDLLKYLNLSPQKTKKKIQRELFVDLNENEQKIYDLLNVNGKQHIDTISNNLGFKTYQLMPILLDLELKSLIEPLPGKFYDTI